MALTTRGPLRRPNILVVVDNTEIDMSSEISARSTGRGSVYTVT